ncbi:MAG: hypothetical protein AAB074_23240 [Planctomycetota bacterium]
MQNTLRIARFSIVLALALGLRARGEPDPAPVRPSGSDPAPREEKPVPALPPIDAAAPAKFETATFALG